MREPFFYADKNTWYVWEGNKKVSLGVRGKGNKDKAFAAWKQKQTPLVTSVIHTYLMLQKEKTRRWYLSLLNPFLTRYPTLLFSELTLSFISQYTLQQRWSPSTQRGFLVMLELIAAWATKAMIISDNPLESIPKPPMSSRGEKALISKEDHLKILQAVSGDFKILLQLLWDTGARPAEVALVTDKTFKPDSGIIVPDTHKMSRKGMPRLVLLPEKSVAVLKRQLELYKEGYLLRNAQGGCFDKNAIVCKLRRLRLKTGIKNLTAYGYRHTFATNALAAGIPEAQVAALLGHSSTVMLERHYNHLLSKTTILRQALKKLAS